jgi:hypothetical protein
LWDCGFQIFAGPDRGSYKIPQKTFKFSNPVQELQQNGISRIAVIAGFLPCFCIKCFIQVTLANLLTISTELLKHVVDEEEENALTEKQEPMASQQKATLKKLLALPGNNMAAGRVHHEYGQVRSVLHKYLEKLRIIEKGKLLCFS